MKTWLNGTLFLVFLSLRMFSGAAVSAQEPGKSPLPLKGTMEIQASNPRGSNPKPADAGRASMHYVPKCMILVIADMACATAYSRPK